LSDLPSSLANGGREPVPTAAILVLGLTQIIGYGTLYYSFSLLAPGMSASLAWPMEWVFGAFSVALLVGGLTAPFLGRAIDRVGAGPIMALGSAVAALAMLGCALAPGRTAFVLTLVLSQAAANFVQYGAAFALLVQIRPQVAHRSITYLTLIAGFASTIFWPVTSFLTAQLSWQQVYIVFALLNLFVCLPLHGWLAFSARAGRRADAPVQPPLPGRLHPDLRAIGFGLMLAGFCLQSLVSAAVLVHMVPLLSGLGLGATAALVGTLFGPSQVMSRLVNMLFGRSLSPINLAVLSAVLIPAGVAILVATAPSTLGAMGFAVIFGMGNGLFSIVAGTLPLTLFGSDGYGSRQGKLMSARLILAAIAPFVLALGMERIGITASLSLVVALGALGCCAFLAIGMLVRRHGAAINV
jgi:hypothetical protein